MPSDKLIQKEKKYTSYIERTSEEANYEEVRFNSAFFGGDQEAEALIERYSKETTLTKEQMETIRNNVPEKADFEIWSEEKYRSKWGITRGKYNRRVKKYMNYRKNYFAKVLKKSELEKNKKLKDGNSFSRTINNIETQVETEKYLKHYDEIEETPEAMDEAFEKMKSEEAKNRELELAGKEIKLHKGSGQVFINYTNSTAMCAQINKSLRDGREPGGLGFAKDMYKSLKNRPLNRDLVVRRGVNGVKTAAAMLGLANFKDLSDDEIKEEIEKRVDNDEEIIMQDKGFVSTSLSYAEHFYSAGNDAEIGIEFIILAKKGTEAVNISVASMHKAEGELLFNAGTKFKLVKAEMDGESNIIEGNKKSWKFYLVSVPQSKDGIMREA